MTNQTNQNAISTKTYSTKATATRGAQRANVNWFDVRKNEEGRFYYVDLAIETYGMTHCPHCGVHLSNGVVDGKTFDHCCLNCGAEFGNEKTLAPDTAPSTAKAAKYFNVEHKSKIESPCAVVHALVDEFYKTHTRKQIIEMAISRGVAFYTARTQYQKWFKAHKNANNDVD